MICVILQNICKFKILSFLQSMRNWLEDLTWGMNALKLVKSRGEIASLLKEVLLEKGLPTRGNLNWDETEINMLKELIRTVIKSLSITAPYSILQDAAAVNNAKEMVGLQMENSQADSEAIRSLLRWYRSMQHLIGNNRPYDLFVREDPDHAIQELTVGLITGR